MPELKREYNVTEAHETIARLREIIRTLPIRLRAISEDRASRKAEGREWSAKQEVGHLIDSASHNHQRIVRTQLLENPALPGYDGDAWVELHRYQERDWSELIQVWAAFNQQFLTAAVSVQDEEWSRTCTIGDSAQLTLAYVFIDYVDHMSNHLRQIGIDISKNELDLNPEETYPEKPAPASSLLAELIDRRWSPSAFDEDRQVEPEKIQILLEAARWAPSCYNEQPWRYLVFDGRDVEALEKARACLVPGNAWALKAPVLMLSVACESFARNGKPNRHGQHDVGLASENLVLQALELELVAHQMAGYDADRARTEFQIPEGFTPMAMIAIGYPFHGDLSGLGEKLKARELSPRVRKSIGEIAFGGTWGRAYE